MVFRFGLGNPRFFTQPWQNMSIFFEKTLFQTDQEKYQNMFFFKTLHHFLILHHFLLFMILYRQCSTFEISSGVSFPTNARARALEEGVDGLQR